MDMGLPGQFQDGLRLNSPLPLVQPPQRLDRRRSKESTPGQFPYYHHEQHF